MIGIISHDNEVAAVREFFQLFKTPWEFFAPDHDYDLVIVTSGDAPKKLRAKALVIYGSAPSPWDEALGIGVGPRLEAARLQWDGAELPVYRGAVSLESNGKPFVECPDRQGVVGSELASQSGTIFRIGYDLFREVSFLLSAGQPRENARIPAMEMHISLLKDCMKRAKIAFVEIPPVPAGYEFAVCLSHDVDFFGIRDHKFDRTMWGFLWRALAGSLAGALKGKLSWSKLWKNWKAAATLPLVHLGILEDFWLEFDRYEALERDRGATYFFIPFKNRPGIGMLGPASKRRAAMYDLGHVRKQVQDLAASSCEIGLHGIDAWNSSEAAVEEMNRIRSVTGQSEVGVRMHWLYFSEATPANLERAGLCYDSTFGYNDAVGFRAGTPQVFCLTGTEGLLELPLTIQDTALFYPTRMGCSEADALDSCRRLIQTARRFGGVLTFNWHTRSLSPERNWGEFYAQLLADLANYRVWFGTAREVTGWFRERRALSFEGVQFQEGSLRLKMAGPMPAGRHPFLIRIHHPQLKAPLDCVLPESLEIHQELFLSNDVEMKVPS